MSVFTMKFGRNLRLEYIDKNIGGGGKIERDILLYKMRVRMRKYKINCETNIGNVRLKNEDNIFCNGIYKKKEEKIFLYNSHLSADILNVVGVFDGMGGYSRGDEAAYIAVRQLKRYLDIVWRDKMPFDSETVFSEINACICRKMSEFQEKMGSTAVLWICENGQVRISNLGDSRAYLYRNGILNQLSTDHTEENSMSMLRKELGIIAAESTLKYKNILTQHLGIEEDEFILEPAETEPIAVQEGDVFLLCTDGLTGVLTDVEILNILTRPGGLELKKKALIEQALDNGSKDNITVVLIET